jgi:Fic family protein
VKIFDYSKLNDYKWDSEVISLIAQIHEHKGKQSLYLKQKPQTLEQLIEIAKIQSTESSNKIEGIITTSTRIKQLMSDKTAPRNRDEEEILGYRNALNIIHESFEYIPITPNYIKQLHHELYKTTTYRNGGEFKGVQNYISAKYPDGHEEILFTPLSPFETPDAIQNLCDEFNKCVDNDSVEALLLIPTFISDFVCIHPFSDGNGRMSRLLTTLLLYRLGYYVSKYISIEKLIEKNKDAYYNALSKVDKGWHENNNDPTPFIKYILRILLTAYREFEERMSLVEAKQSSYDYVKNTIDQILGKFSKAELLERCPSIAKSTLEATLKKLVEDGYIKKSGQCKSTFYYKT